MLFRSPLQTDCITETLGTSIEVWGSVGVLDLDLLPITEYRIDDGPATIYSPDKDTLGSQQSSGNVTLYRSPPLDPGEHTIVVTNRNFTSPAHFDIDYILYTPVSNDSNSTLQAPDGPSPTPNAPSVPKVGLVVGSVLGGTVLLLLVSLLLFVYIRRWSHQDLIIKLPDTGTLMLNILCTLSLTGCHSRV